MCSNLSNFNYKPQLESRQQHLALYMDRHLRSVAIMIEVTSRHMECTHFNPNYSRMPVVALKSHSCAACPTPPFCDSKALDTYVSKNLVHFSTATANCSLNVLIFLQLNVIEYKKLLKKLKKSLKALWTCIHF